MKSFFTFSFLFISSLGFSQVQITSSSMPHANDALVQQNVTVATPSPDLEQAGASQVWNYGPDVITYLGTTTNTNCIDVSSTPFTYQFLFNNPFDPTHNSDFATGLDSLNIGTYSLQDIYGYFQITNSKYVQTGVGATIQGIPIPAQSNPVDIIYHLPLNYLDTDSAYSETNFNVPTVASFQQRQWRKNTVDGWGTLNIADQSFDVLRVKTIVYTQDSINIAAFGTGFLLPMTTTVEYKWLSTLYRVPVLQINTSAGLVTSALTADIFVTVDESNATAFSIYPNPCVDRININGNILPTSLYTIYSINGEIIRTGLVGSRSIDVASLSKGSYILSIQNNGKSVSKMFVK